jgi:hypothetical protein
MEEAVNIILNDGFPNTESIYTQRSSQKAAEKYQCWLMAPEEMIGCLN